MAPSSYKSFYGTNLLMYHLFKFIAVDGTYIFFNHLFSTFLVRQLVPLCLGW